MLEGRFVAVDDGGLRQRGLDLVVARLQCGGRSLLLLDHPTGRARHAEQRTESQRGATLRLAEQPHQDRRDRDEPRSGHVFGDALGKLRTGRPDQTNTVRNHDTSVCDADTP